MFTCIFYGQFRTYTISRRVPPAYSADATPFLSVETPYLQYTGDVCLGFYYHMSGRDVGRLVVYAGSGLDREVFSITGEQGSDWRRAEVDARLSSGDKVSTANCTDSLDSIDKTAVIQLWITSRL